MMRLKQMRPKLRFYLEMPVAGTPTLPQAWLAHTRIASWPIASLAASAALYLPLFILAVLNEPDIWLNQTWWRYALLYPTMTVYLLLLIPVFRRLRDEAIDAFVPLLPAAEASEKWAAEPTIMNRRHEWLVFGLGMVAGWLITPFEALSGFWQILYALAGEGLNIGLLSWLAFNIVAGTKQLTTLHNQTRGLNIPRPGLFTPLGRWSLGILLAFLVGSLANALFIPQRDFLSPKNIIIYGILNLLVLLVFLRTSESASLLAQFRIFRAFSLFVLVALMGTLGYHYLEGWDPLDGLYMTIITMTTIGYGEIGPLQTTGRIFTIILSLVSVGIAGYALSAVVAFVFEGDFHRIIRGQKMNKQIAKLNNHIILCGAGHIGEQIALEFIKTHTHFLLIDEHQEELEEILRLGDIPYVLGDPTEDETLHLARIGRAKGLVANLADDKENAFVVLTARSLNPQLRIVARLTDEKNEEKLRKVGADAIVSPSVIGGLRMASVMIRPSVVTFLDEMMRGSGQTLRLEEARLSENSTLVGKTLVEANIGQRSGLLVVAIRSPDGLYQFNPQGQTKLKANDTLIVIGTPQQLANLHQLEAN